jgi:hypothetical protein
MEGIHLLFFLHAAIYLEVSLFRWTRQNAFLPFTVFIWPAVFPSLCLCRLLRPYLCPPLHLLPPPHPPQAPTALHICKFLSGKIVNCFSLHRKCMCTLVFEATNRAGTIKVINSSF